MQMEGTPSGDTEIKQIVSPDDPMDIARAVRKFSHVLQPTTSEPESEPNEKGIPGCLPKAVDSSLCGPRYHEICFVDIDHIPITLRLNDASTNLELSKNDYTILSRLTTLGDFALAGENHRIDQAEAAGEYGLEGSPSCCRKG